MYGAYLGASSLSCLYLHAAPYLQLPWLWYLHVSVFCRTIIMHSWGFRSLWFELPSCDFGILHCSCVLCRRLILVIQFALWFKHQQRCGVFRDLHCCQSYRCDCWSDGYGDLVAILCVGFVLMLFRCFGDWCCFLLRCERWGCCRFTAAWWCCRFHSSLMNIALLCHCILSVSVICLFFSAYVCFRSYLSARVGECWLSGSVAALMFASAAPASLLAAAILCNCNMVQCLHCLSVLSFCLW